MEKSNLYSSGDFLSRDEGFRVLLKDLCLEIDKIDTNFLSTVSLLSKIPYELAMLVVDNIKYDKEGYLGVLNTLYYEEFKADVKSKENNKTTFENRILSQRSKDYIEFAMNRLVTLGEIENLINIFIDDEKLNLTLEDIIDEKKEFTSKNIKILSNAHKILSENQNLNINKEIVKKMENFWLDLTLRRIIEFKEKQRLNA